MARKQRNSQFDYDVCLSFAGEDRAYVRKVAEFLIGDGVRVFYDEYEQANLWGKDLYEHLDDVYKNSARYCVLFVSKHYAGKVWTNHERKSAQERALKENREYILPALFDDTEIPGLRRTVGHVDLRNFTPEAFAELIVKKIGKSERRNYLPPKPDRLFHALNLRAGKGTETALLRADKFLRVLTRMSADEREIIFHLFQEGCTTELPENIHMNADLLRRATGFSLSKIIRLLERLPSLGFMSRLREDDESYGTLGRSQMVVLEWHDFAVDDDDEDGNATEIAVAMINSATENLCPECGIRTLRRLDFSQLATRTATQERHKKRIVAQQEKTLSA